MVSSQYSVKKKKKKKKSHSETIILIYFIQNVPYVQIN